MEKSSKPVKLKSKKKRREEDSSDAGGAVSTSFIKSNKKRRSTESHEQMPDSKKAKLAYAATVKVIKSEPPKEKSKVPHNVKQCSSSSTSVSFSPLIAQVTDLETTPTEGVASSSRKGKKKKSKDRQKDLELNEDSDSGSVAGMIAPGKVTPSSSTTDVSATDKKRRKKRSPVLDSYLAQAGAVIMYKCVQGALMKGKDHRCNLQQAKWGEVLSEVSISAKDLHLIWLLISKQFEGVSLEDVSSALKSHATITPSHLVWKDAMTKLKGEKPKAPLTAYLLYCQTMRPKFKEKYPNLTHGQLAIKMGKKWKSLSEEKQHKYRSEYQRHYKEYKLEMDRFLDEHPEAKSSRMRSKSKTFSMESRKQLKLKELKPKAPPSALTLFVKEKEASVRKKHPGMSARDVRSKLSNQWKSMSVLDIAPYRKKHLQLNTKYEEDLVKFFTDNPDAERLLMRGGRASKKRAQSVTEDSSESTLTTSTEPTPLHRTSRKKKTDSSSSDDDDSDDDDEDSDSDKELDEALFGPQSMDATPTPNNPHGFQLAKEVAPAASSLLMAGEPSSSTPYPTKRHANSTHHIPIIDSEDLSSLESEDSSAEF